MRGARQLYRRAAYQEARPLARLPQRPPDGTREPLLERLGGWRRLLQRDPFDLAALALLAALAAIAVATFRDYGISNDEEVQHRYGELIISYYASGFADRSLFGYRNLYLYGGLFDIVAVLLGKVAPLEIYQLRHLLCALIGVAGIGAVWATARLVGGARAGFIAALALALTAEWYGAMFNHTKDIPFAAAMAGAVYFLLRAGRDLPQPRWRDTLCFGLLLGAACGLRAMGLLLIGYAALLIGWHLTARLGRGRADATRFVGQTAWRFLPGLLLGYALMLAAWPWASLELLNPLRAISAFAHFHYEIRTILAGQIYEMADVPRYYVTAYLLIRLPLLVLAGALLAAAIAATPRAWRGPGAAPALRRDIVLLWLTVVIPVAAQVVGHGPAFTGMRHFFFVVPPLAVLAGVGIDGALAWLAGHRRVLVPAAAAMLAAAFLWEASLIVRLHPHQYLYYNALVGGLSGAAGRYALDYWVNIMPEAVTSLERYVSGLKGEPAGRVYTVGVCGERLSFEKEADRRLRWTGGWYEADFFIAPTHMNCDRATNGRIIARIERLGVLIGVVKDRRGYPPPATSLAQ